MYFAIVVIQEGAEYVIITAGLSTMIRDIVIIVERPAVMIAWITTSSVCVAQTLNRNPMITMIIIPIVQGPKYFYIKNKVILIVVNGGRSYMNTWGFILIRERATQENTYNICLLLLLFVR